MPHLVPDLHGEPVEVASVADIKAVVDESNDAHGNALAAKVLRWLLGGGLGLVAGGVMLYARMDNRLTNVEKEDTKTATARASETAELRSVIRKVDSLTYVIGTQTELLRSIDRRLR